MYQIVTSSRFRKDLKKCKKQGKPIVKLKEIDQILSKGKNLPIKNRDHSLTGNWEGFRECHIEPDWLLIYRIDEDEKTIIYTRTGSHSELFK